MTSSHVDQRQRKRKPGHSEGFQRLIPEVFKADLCVSPQGLLPGLNESFF